MTMTPEAKSQLSTTIRGLRARLLDDLHHAVEGAYRMSVRARDAGLSEVPRTKRKRLEEWIDEQVRIEATGAKKAAVDEPALRARFQADAEKQAAYTLLNRIVIVRLMEATSLRAPEVVTKGWESPGYKAFRQLAPALRNDETEGYAFLLQLVFDDLAVDLPGLFGPVGIADLVPIPPATLRHVIEALDDAGLVSCWTDDMTLGWVYQYWNDPEREAIDAKLNAGGKVEPHEIASKTQMFTERYMVDWLLQNSLGAMWLAMCRKHGWVADVEKHGVLDALEARRVEWRKKRDAGQVSLTALMPLQSDIERRWAYYLPQPIPDDAVATAPETVRALRILDPAVGSGHFLVVAFDLLFALYQEEAQHRGVPAAGDGQPKAVVESILENNLHGIDLDARAVQIAAAALWMKAQQTARGAAPKQLNLVASALRLANLPENDTALVELRKQVEADTGIPAALTDTIVHALRGADHLGSLLKVDRAVDDAIRAYEGRGPRGDKPVQGGLFGDTKPQQLRIDAESARASVLDSLEKFLDQHTKNDELGLRLHGEQLATGVRFVRLLKEGTYDLVVGNPPYQGTAKMKDASYVAKHYPKGKADLYAAFLERGLQLAREGGTSSLLTMRNWMFIRQYAELRQWLLETFDLRGLGDFNKGGFEAIPDEVVSVVVSIFRRAKPGAASVAQMPTALDDNTRDSERTPRKRAAMLAGVERHDFDAAALRVVPEWPLVYWWSSKELEAYGAGTLSKVAPSRKGLITSDNVRFLRLPWEPAPFRVDLSALITRQIRGTPWAPLMSGAKSRRWIEPLADLILWDTAGLEVKVLNESKYGSYTRQVMNEQVYFTDGVAFVCIGAEFGARLHRYSSVISSTGCSVYPADTRAAVCLMNSTRASRVLSSLNPTIHFTNGDVDRLPLFEIADHAAIVGELERAFEVHESHREPSVEYRLPGPSPWRAAQQWAQAAVDRGSGAPLIAFREELNPEPPADHVSFALGVAFGRFGTNDEGILDPTTADLTQALPAGLCFLDGTLDAADTTDSLGHGACALLRTTWTERGPTIDADTDLRTWLRTKFFPDVHKGMYENRPIHWPLSSRNKTFVAWINIHRMNESTLRVLLADHLEPTRKRLDGELADLRAARDGTDKKAAKAAEKRFAAVQKAREELDQFIKDVEQCAERGPPASDAKCEPRDLDARFAPDLDDGVMINSAALWPLLEPQWKDPKKWWKELSNAEGKKDYDWSHLAMRYWPRRVDEKCQQDPSLGVAHGCFWRYHPSRAWAWELRLQDEIGPGFRIEEKPYRGGAVTDDAGDVAHRARFLKEHAREALEAVEKEALRRARKQKKPQAELRLLEAGLWSALPDECWALELRLSEKQGVEFHLHAPDEEKARKAFTKANPAEVVKRDQLVAKLQPLTLALDADDGAVGDDADEAEDDEEAAE
ncbi:MAG: BREX-6 system adenine-specific DNA-methyltransferase PglX [Deltaproteobacteria bacterium]|nr:BREX-6 system adenine-specific DNA-methyltransferase PglX [Deltaproteobacteria bacterium]